jgi:tryptophan synthase alpha chain
MSRINELFNRKQNNVLNIYCTAGYPRFDSTLKVMNALQENSVDIIELGIPYSDPLADGPVIQMSNSVALKNGMTIKKLFEQLKNLRSSIQIPVLLMGYLNPVLQYGFEKFCTEAATVGVDGLIIPDLPQYEFEKDYRTVIKKYGLDFVFLVTPETSTERIKRLDELSSGFLYAVSSSSTTGSNKNADEMQDFIKKLQNLELKNPVLVGFGIKDKSTFEAACKYSNGAIIGSAYIKAIENVENVNAATKSFVSSVLG